MFQNENTFSGGVFSDTIDGGRAGAEIHLTPDSLYARTTEGDQFAIRYSDCHLDIGGFDNKMVFCRNEDKSLNIFCDDKRFLDALSKASRGTLDRQLQVKREQVKQQKRRSSRFTTALVTAFAIALVGLYFGIRWAGTVAVQAVPVSVDEKIGDASFSSMGLSGDEVNDPVVVGAMKKIVQQLAPHACIDGMEFDVHVVRSEEINAFALPGGTIVVFTGLIEQADAAEQVAGVLAHEMAHATLRHGLERISQSLGVAAAVNLLLGDVQGLVVLGSELFQMATINSYSRGQETEADLEGARMLHEAGIDPDGLAQFFEILKQQDNNLPGGLEWISTHPEHDSRIEGVHDLVAGYPKKEYKPIDIDWANVKEHLTQ